MSQLKKGVVLSYLNIIITTITGLLLTPFIIRSLGNSEYGLYLLIGSFVAYLSLMDMGLTNTIVRFVATYRYQKDYMGEQKFLGTIMIIYIIISVVLVIIGIILYINLENIFSKSLTQEQLSDAKIMFLILIFNLAITLPGGSFTAICNAYEQFAFPRLVAIIRLILRSVTVLAIVSLGGKSVALVIIDTCFNIAVVIVTVYYTYSKLKIKFLFSEQDWIIIKEIFSYSVWIFVLIVVQTFQWQAGQIVLGINLNTEVVAIYAVGIMLGSFYGSFGTTISGVLLPRATQMITANESSEELTKTMTMVGRLNNILMLFILSGFFLFGREFILLWVGADYKESWIVAILIMVVLTIPLNQIFGNAIIEAKKKVAFKAVLNLSTVIAGVVAGFFFSTQYGILGMIIPIAISFLINTIIINLYFIRIFQFNPGFFFKSTFLLQMTIVGLLCILISGFKMKYEINSWKALFSAILVYTMIYFPTYYFLLLNNKEKVLLKSFLR